ncbi:phosphatidate cytidylyltransferase [Aliidiomarina soli]|uniref:Phosphatidate cytidylyltransferase n=1 Tax=Aliidiomarina soli TaxID=1928574 RepID=A0A432WLI3_9GAMM|nr:phosphatidate cytidylyltransferase [Aliidiomarina soli]RUO34670.1 CDP-diglyceride synthetase [Aliidiomarina soli]
MLKQRILTALVLIPLALYCIFFLSLNGFAIFALAALSIGAWEWSPLMGVRRLSGRIAYTVLVAALIAVLYVLAPINSLWSEQGLAQPMVVAISAGVIWWLAAILMVLNFPGSQRLWRRSRVYVGVFGVLVLVPAWAALISIRALNYDLNPLFGAWTVLFIFVLVWAADVGAYAAGRAMGKHKMIPAVSPNKTIEGLCGGVVLAFVIMVLVAQLLPIPRELYVGFYSVGLATVIVSVFGDLSESMFKRCAGVKDSGSILPGHGGVLDRIDSLTSALPVFVLGYLMLIHPALAS